MPNSLISSIDRARTKRTRRLRLQLGTTIAVMLLLAGAGAAWALGAPGFPYGRDPDAELLPEITARDGGIVIVAVGMLGAIAHSTMLAITVRPRASRLLAIIGPASGAAVGAVLALVFPTGRVLQNFAYALALQFSRLDWPVAFQAMCVAAGALSLYTCWRFYAESSGACADCGALAGRHRWTDPARAANWGRRFAWLSAVAALPYPLVRLVNIALILLGVSGTGGQEAGPLLLIMTLFVVLALGGATLTIGLFRPWGSVFSRRIPLVGGRRVPVGLAVVPAAWVAVILTVTGAQTLLNLAVGRVGSSPLWQQIVSGASWTVWGAALGAASAAYYLMRRRMCDSCRHESWG